MPLFRFDVSDGRCAADTKGAELADEMAARREAIRRAAMLVRASHDRPDSARDWKINVRDAAGVVVFWIDARLGIFPVPH